MVPSISIISPILKARSVMTKRPEMTFETEVWAAKPMAIPAIPAAPNMALILIPSRLKIVTTITVTAL